MEFVLSHSIRQPPIPIHIFRNKQESKFDKSPQKPSVTMIEAKYTKNKFVSSSKIFRPISNILGF